MLADLGLGLVGFYLLVRGAGLLVEGATALGRRYAVSEITIGLTVVAFGTSMPEFAVNVVAALSGTADIALGNVLGSNIANLLLILGASAFFVPLAVRKKTTYNEVPFALLASVVLAIEALDTYFARGSTGSALGLGDGLVLLAFFIIFLYYTASIAREARESIGDIESGDEHPPLKKIFGYIVGGLAGLVLGGTWIVEGATTLAAYLGASETLIGLTIVAVGTSLPELASSITAARRGKTDLVIGNIVGSNIFNTFWILGVTAILLPLPITAEHLPTLAVNSLATLLVFTVLLLGKRHSISRTGGGLLVLCYLAYLALLAATA